MADNKNSIFDFMDESPLGNWLKHEKGNYTKDSLKSIDAIKELFDKKKVLQSQQDYIINENNIVRWVNNEEIDSRSKKLITGMKVIQLIYNERKKTSLCFYFMGGKYQTMAIPVKFLSNESSYHINDSSYYIFSNDFFHLLYRMYYYLKQVYPLRKPEDEKYVTSLNEKENPYGKLGVLLTEGLFIQKYSKRQSCMIINHQKNY